MKRKTLLCLFALSAIAITSCGTKLTEAEAGIIARDIDRKMGMDEVEEPSHYVLTSNRTMEYRGDQPNYPGSWSDRLIRQWSEKDEYYRRTYYVNGVLDSDLCIFKKGEKIC